MINHDLIIEELKRHELTQGQIAQKCNCSVETVARAAKSNGLQFGRGIKKWWEFKGSSPELAYVIGAYITDGTLGREYQKPDKTRQLVVTSTTPEFTDEIFRCLETIHAYPRMGTTRIPGTKTSDALYKLNDIPLERRTGHRGLKPIYVVSSYSSMFCQWLFLNCKGKSRIPPFFFDAPLADQLAFLAGAIDGDGSVSLAGSIKIAGIDGWLSELPMLLHKMGVRTTGFQFDRVLPSGKIFSRVSINRMDVRKLGIVCILPEKQRRILEARELRYRIHEAPKKPCPQCGKPMVVSSKRCQSCYMASEQFHDHLKEIAPKGNKAANKARWGHIA